MNNFLYVKFYIIFEVWYEKNGNDTRRTVLMKNQYIIRYDIYNFGLNSEK